MTLTEAHDYVRKLRQPPFDDADTDYDFVRMWERRHYLFAVVFLIFACVLASFGIDGSFDTVWIIWMLGFAVDQAWRCRRYRKIRRMFEEHAPQSFDELQKTHHHELLS